jgi:hypothetical protein
MTRCALLLRNAGAMVGATRRSCLAITNAEPIDLAGDAILPPSIGRPETFRHTPGFWRAPNTNLHRADLGSARGLLLLCWSKRSARLCSRVKARAPTGQPAPGSPLVHSPTSGRTRPAAASRAADLRFHPRLGRAARFRLRVRAAAPTGQPESGSPLVHSPISSVRLPQSARSLSSSRVLASRDRVGDIAIVSPPPDGRRTALEWRDRRRHFLFAEPRALTTGARSVSCICKLRSRAST